MLENIADAFEVAADALGDRIAIVQADVQRSWRDFDDRSARLASAFAELGVGRGTTVAIDLRNCIENVEALYAALKVRAVPFNVNFRYRERELTYLLNDAKPAVIVYDHGFADRVLPAIKQSGLEVHPIEVSENTTEGTFSFEQLIAKNEPAPRMTRDGDDEFVIYTGGTTGYPKGVIWAHSNSLALPMVDGKRPSTPEEYTKVLRATPQQARLVIAPLMHATGLLGTFAALTSGGPLIFCASPSLNPDEVLGLIEKHRVTQFGFIGDAIARPILGAIERAEAEGHPYDLSSVKTITNTGGMWSAQVKRALLNYGRFTILDGVNATEGAGFATAQATTPDDIETAKFRLGANARILDEAGKDVVPGSGEIGMLATTGRLPKGYLNDPVRTARTFPVIDGVRYSMPGDLATVEADGTVTLLGRGSEVINTGGEKVFVEELENSILTHPAVFDAIVVGLPDERWGTRVAAVVSLRDGASATERDIIDHVGKELADYKRPRTVVFVPQIPRSPSGKADRPAVKRLAEEAVL